MDPVPTEFTREYRAAHDARLNVLDQGVAYQVETESRPFDGVAADVKDGEHAVWITFGSKPGDHLAHGIHRVTAIQVLPPTTSRFGSGGAGRQQDCTGAHPTGGLRAIAGEKRTEHVNRSSAYPISGRRWLGFK